MREAIGSDYTTSKRLATRSLLCIALVALALLSILGLLAQAAQAASPGQLYAFGLNTAGQLANSTNLESLNPNPTPVLVSIPAAPGPISQAAAGIQSSAVVTTSGQLYTFGRNNEGQLGVPTNSGTETPIPNPELVSLPGASGPVAQVAAGFDHTLALTSTGQLFAFGGNSSGELGRTANETANPTPTLVNLPGANGATTKVAAGFDHSLALTATGQLLAWGLNSKGQLGIATNAGTMNPNPTPTLVSLPGASGPVTDVAGGGEHTLAVTSTGQLYAFGSNAAGQLGSAANANANPTPALVSLPGATGPAVQVAAGIFHSVVLTSTGQVYAFGANQSGELGTTTNSGTENPTPTPTLVNLPAATGPVVRIAAAYKDSFAVTSTGQLFGFGQNATGTLGTVADSGTSNANPMPLLAELPAGTRARAVFAGASAFHTFVITDPIPPAPPPPTPSVAPIRLTVPPPTAAQIKAVLLSQLTPKGKAAKIAALLKKRSYTLSFRALSAGRALIDWYFLPKGAHVSKKRPKPKPVLFAEGKRSFAAPGTLPIVVKLTAKGTKLIKHTSSLKLTAKGSFTPLGQKAVTAVRAFKLSR
jgi:alpha-tubulin suppressor-like RCC1 family protein